MTRSYLFVPADSRHKLSKASDVDADALILDLEDSVAAAARTAAREHASEIQRTSYKTWLRINTSYTDAARA